MFGSGNLGIKGIALFLYTHRCNPICKHYNLPEFVLFEDQFAEVPSLSFWRGTSMTKSFKSKMIRGQKDDTNTGRLVASANTPGLRHSPQIARKAASEGPRVLPVPPESQIPPKPDITALIHYEIAKLHSCGKLSAVDSSNYQVAVEAGLEGKENFDKTPDVPAAFYHFQTAALGGCVDALLACARIFSPKQEVLEGGDALGLANPKRAVKLIKLAADRGSKDASYWMSQYLEKGIESIPNWRGAKKYYEALLTKDFEPTDDLYGWESPIIEKYEIKAALAKLYATGGNELKQDKEKAYELYNEAVEEAVSLRKGKDAMIYYQRIEELDI